MHTSLRRRAPRLVCAVALLTTGPARAESADELAQKVQNPVADLITIPFQETLEYGIGSFDRARATLKIEPVVPVDLSQRWKLIVRTIAPFTDQPDATAATGGSSGLGDIQPTLFLSRAKPGRIIWGAGPVFSLPTATQRATGSGKWSAGPSVVVLSQTRRWTIGVLASNLWSFAGPADRAKVNTLSLQPFVNLNLRSAFYLTSHPEMSADWTASAGDRWLVPVGGGFGKVVRLGQVALHGEVAAYYNAIRPDTPPNPSWALRLQISLLLPE